MKYAPLLLLLLFLAGCKKPDIVQRIYVDNQSSQELRSLQNMIGSNDTTPILIGENKKIQTISFDSPDGPPSCSGTSGFFIIETVSGDSMLIDFREESNLTSVYSEADQSQECTVVITDNDIQ